MVRRKLAPSRQAAQQMIEANQVLVDGSVADKPARMVNTGQNVRLSAPPPRFVSRGGLKLEKALDTFEIDPDGWRCLDAGSSTGGFTDCLLSRGAQSVVAVDVGTNQLHERIRRNRRVTVMEQTDIRSLGLDDFDYPIDLIVADLSFISLRTVLASLAQLANNSAPILALVKPQFEAGKAEASKGRGVITDPAIWRRVLSEVADEAARYGLVARNATVSPITGGAGNVEFIVWFDSARPQGYDKATEAVVFDMVVASGEGTPR